MRVALALGGGAGLGWAHIGVLHALQARGVIIDAVSGTSIGALAAVCLAADRVNVLEAIARSVNARQVVQFIDIDPRRGSMLGGRAVTRQLRQHFGHGHLEDLFIPVAERRISPGSSVPFSIKVFVIRGIGAWAKLSRRPLPVGATPISRALSRSCI